MRDLSPMLKLGGLIAGAVAVIAVLVIFVIIPLFSGGKSSPVTEVSNSPTPKPTPAITGDISDKAEELASITQSAIDDPFVYGGKVIFTTGEDIDNINTLSIYDMASKETTSVSGITKKYKSLFEPKMNDDYIVYLDCKSEYGGAVCGYDIAKGQSFVIREYLYGKPRVALSGKYALWLQQTGPDSDKLYLYDLETKECATIEKFMSTEFIINSAYMSGDSIVFVQPEGQERVLNTSSKSDKAQICILKLAEQGDKNRAMFTPGTYVYMPMISGNSIVYLNGSGDENSSLMYVNYENGSFSAPVEIAKDVLYYCVGDGYVVYTKDDRINIYYFKDGSTGTLSPESTRAVVASANGKDVIWYDVTDADSEAGDVVMHIQVP